MGNMHTATSAAKAPFPPYLTKSDNTEGYSPDAEDLRGLFEYRFETAGGLVIKCYLEHTKAEAATDVAPGTRESMEMIWGCVRGVDVSELLVDVKDVIEAEALSEVRS